MATHFVQEDSMDRGAWWATVHRVAKSQTRLSKCEFTLALFILFESVIVIRRG